MNRILAILAIALAWTAAAQAQETRARIALPEPVDSVEELIVIIPTAPAAAPPAEEAAALDDDLVVVGNDTVSIIIPEAFSIGRYNRGLYNYLFIPKGQWAFGLTASYGEFDADDVQVLSILKDFDFKGKIYSLEPTVSYFFRNNQSLGLRFSYNRAEADMPNLSVDFDEDMSFTVKDVSYYSQSYGLSMFYRNYVGLSKLKRFGIFNEVELSFKSGSSRFKRIYDGEPKDTRTITTGAALNFSPGVMMYIMDFVSFNVSFGVFGIHLTKDTQKTDNIDEGSRVTSGANFKFNLFNIKFGACVNI